LLATQRIINMNGGSPKNIFDELPHAETDHDRADQIEGRSLSGCLVFIDGKPCCSMHETPLDDGGLCDTCEGNADEAAAEAHLAHLERLGDCLAETDDDSTLEENLPFYGKDGC
jgi:hypothetical protein